MQAEMRIESDGAARFQVWRDLKVGPNHRGDAVDRSLAGFLEENFRRWTTVLQFVHARWGFDSTLPMRPVIARKILIGAARDRCGGGRRGFRFGLFFDDFTFPLDGNPAPHA